MSRPVALVNLWHRVDHGRWSRCQERTSRSRRPAGWRYGRPRGRRARSIVKEDEASKSSPEELRERSRPPARSAARPMRSCTCSRSPAAWASTHARRLGPARARCRAWSTRCSRAIPDGGSTTPAGCRGGAERNKLRRTRTINAKTIWDNVRTRKLGHHAVQDAVQAAGGDAVVRAAWRRRRRFAPSPLLPSRMKHRGRAAGVRGHRRLLREDRRSQARRRRRLYPVLRTAAQGLSGLPEVGTCAAGEDPQGA